MIGLKRTSLFFIDKDKIKGTAAFFGGILVLLLGWPILGMIIEMYGFVALFGGFFPMAIKFLRCVPVVSTILALPGISDCCNSIAGEDPMKTN